MKFLNCVIAVSLVAPVFAKTEIAERMDNSIEVLNSMTSAPDNSIPQSLLDKASCVVVVPGLKRGGFIIAARYGKGFVSCRQTNGTGWTAPGSVEIEGGSFGFQIGASENDIVMLVMNQKGMDRLFTNQFTLGADASIAGGPVGRTLSAQTGGFLTAEILSWSRSRGAFAGVALQGATLRQDTDANEQLYGKPLTNREVIEGDVSSPKVAGFVAALDRISPRKTG